MNIGVYVDLLNPSTIVTITTLAYIVANVSCYWFETFTTAMQTTR